MHVCSWSSHMRPQFWSELAIGYCEEWEAANYHVIASCIVTGEHCISSEAYIPQAQAQDRNTLLWGHSSFSAQTPQSSLENQNRVRLWRRSWTQEGAQSQRADGYSHSCLRELRQPWISRSNSMIRWKSMKATRTQVAHQGTKALCRFSPMNRVGAAKKRTCLDTGHRVGQERTGTHLPAPWQQVQRTNGSSWTQVATWTWGWGGTRQSAAVRWRMM